MRGIDAICWAFALFAFVIGAIALICLAVSYF